MSAYVVIRVKTNIPAQLEPYQNIAPSIIEEYGGKFLARGGKVMTLEGTKERRRIVLIEFPSLDHVKQFYYSQEYAAAIELRKDIADFEIISIDGLN